jgi:hypothetical protein
VTAAKSRNTCNHLQNHVPVKICSRKHRKKINPQEFWQERFFWSKNKFLKTEIYNLADVMAGINVRVACTLGGGLVGRHLSWTVVGGIGGGLASRH